MLFLYSGNERSAGAAKLARELDIRRIKHQNSRLIPSDTTAIINWGSHIFPEWRNNITQNLILNKPYRVATTSNKLSFFQLMDGTGLCPEYTTDVLEATEWIEQGNYIVVCRTLLNASGGRGIVLATNLGELVAAPLYVKYKKKRDEYRVHVFKGVVFDTQKKLVRRAFDGDVNRQIRNFENGYIFARQSIETPAQVNDVARLAMEKANLDFGGVDVIWNDRENRAYVLEINTAPGLEGTTVSNYGRVISRWYDGMRGDRH